jgi:hypothetical protein
MRRIGIIAVLSLLVTALAAVPALAQNPHFGTGARAAVFTDLGTQLQVTGTIVGLGQEPLNITVVADAVAEVECENPGGNIAPGQDQTLTVTAESGPVQPDRQGRYVIEPGTLVTDVPTVGPEACPNPQWTPRVTDVTFSNIQVFVEQPIGTEPVLIATFPGTL